MAHSDGTPLTYEGSIYTKMNDEKWRHLPDRYVHEGDSMSWASWSTYLSKECYYLPYGFDLSCTSTSCQCSCHEPAFPEGLI